MTTTEHLSTTSPGWPAMWEALADATGDYADCNPEGGECWQYTGTYGGIHQFRHRHRPATAPPIKGFAGKHCDRVYLHIDAESLQVTRVHVRRYLDDKPSDYIPAGLTDSRAIGERTEAGREANRLRQFDERHYSGAFDGFSVISDADPGL